MAESVRLGAGGAQLPEECFTFLTKIHYKAPMPGESPQWGEHEIDYILVARPDADLTIVRPRYPSRARATRAPGSRAAPTALPEAQGEKASGPANAVLSDF